MKLDFEKTYDKVPWPFFMEVLERKIFPFKWREWVEQVVSGGRVGGKSKGGPGTYFKTLKDLRQGVPLFPLLFYLVADGMTTLLARARDAGLIRGLVLDLIEGGLTHMQYVDDTIIFLEVDRR
jgi:hypothetical protein